MYSPVYNVSIPQMDADEVSLCHSIKSKKNPTMRCAAKATHGDFCARHRKSKILWTSTNRPNPIVMTRKQKAALEKIYKWWVLHGRQVLRRIHGPATFVPEISHNDRDIFNLEPISKIPLMYHFSYIDTNNHLWTFDMRFLVQLLHYGGDLKNPYSQEILPKATIVRLHGYTQNLIRHKIPVIYCEQTTLTPEQAWNQKVLDVFLKMNSLGYGVNLIWFEAMGIRHHHFFYTSLYNLWNTHLNLTHEQKESVIPGYDSGRSPLFRWTPHVIIGSNRDIKWWRKNNLSLMNSFISRGGDRVVQSTGVLYVLTALVTCSRGAAEAFPWLA